MRIDKGFVLAAALAVAVGCSRSSVAAFEYSFKKTTVGGNDVYVLTVVNDGYDGTGTKIRGIDLVIKTTANLIFQTTADVDGDDSGDVNTIGQTGFVAGSQGSVNSPFLAFGSGLGSFMRIGVTNFQAGAWANAVQFQNVNGSVNSGTSLPWTSDLDADGTPDNNPLPAWAGVKTWRQYGILPGSGLDATQGLAIANIVVPAGTQLGEPIDLSASRVLGDEGIEQGFYIPEPASLGLLGFGGLRFLARRSRKA